MNKQCFLSYVIVVSSDDQNTTVIGANSKQIYRSDTNIFHATFSTHCGIHISAQMSGGIRDIVDRLEMNSW